MPVRHRYRVGYQRPPLESRFKPGKSGNPTGRPKGARNLTSDLDTELMQRMVVRENGLVIRISKQQAALKVLIEKALRGDLRAIALLLDLSARHLDESISQEDGETNTERDRAILIRSLERLNSELRTDRPKGGAK
jgi:hypothetical protein